MTPRRLAWATVLAVALTGCGGSDAGPSESSPVVEAHGPTGPLAGITLATAVRPDGTLVREGLNFLTTDRRVVAIVHVGDAPATGSLRVTWSRVVGKTAEPLFHNDIRVRDGARAASTALLSPGVPVAGRYRVEAKLGSESKTVDWMLAEDPRRAADDLAVAYAGPRSAGMTLIAAQQSGEPTQESEPKKYRCCPPYKSQAPPEPGVPAPRQPPISNGTATEGPCTLTASADPSGETTVVTVDASGCPDDEFEVYAGPNGNETYVGSFKGDTLRYLSADPCKVQGSDLPGATIKYTVRAAAGPHKGLTATAQTTIIDDAAPPVLVATADPPPGAQVQSGDTIRLSLDAREFRRGAAAASGIRELRVEPEAGVNKKKSFPEPKRCDESRNSRTFEVTLTVPDGVGDFFDVTVAAVDYAGHERTLLLQWPTNTYWVGIAELTATGGVPGNMCRATFILPIRLVVDEDGKVDGRVEVEVDSGPTCTLGFFGPGPSGIVLKVSGTFRRASGFRLTFVATEASGYDVALHTLWLPSPREISVPLAGKSKAFALGRVDLSQSAGVEGASGTASLTGEVPLECLSCYAASGW